VLDIQDGRKAVAELCSTRAGIHGLLQYILVDFRDENETVKPCMRRFGISFLSLLLSSQHLNAQDLMGWPNFYSVSDTIQSEEIETQAAPGPKKRIYWLPWKDMRTYRYRTGCRYASNDNWERYIMFQSHENVRFSESNALSPLCLMISFIAAYEAVPFGFQSAPQNCTHPCWSTKFGTPSFSGFWSTELALSLPCSGRACADSV
jgi:hypothetical protein